MRLGGDTRLVQRSTPHQSREAFAKSRADRALSQPVVSVTLRYSDIRGPCAPTSHILHELEFELLSFCETIEYTPRQRPVMKENFLPVFSTDKTKPTLPNHSYNPTSLHPTLLHRAPAAFADNCRVVPLAPDMQMSCQRSVDSNVHQGRSWQAGTQKERGS
jgi:hypothetical protein